MNGTRFPAGSYILDNSIPTMIIVRSKDGRLVEQAATLVKGDAVDPLDARVIFIARRGRYDLAKIWGARGKRILTSHVTEETNGDTREVKMRSNGVTSEAKEPH